MSAPRIPCARCGLSREHYLHEPAARCDYCLAPEDHHAYALDSDSAEALVNELLEALRRIADHEPRADRRRRGMVDASEVEDLRRLARAAIAKAEGR